MSTLVSIRARLCEFYEGQNIAPMLHRSHTLARRGRVNLLKKVKVDGGVEVLSRGRRIRWALGAKCWRQRCPLRQASRRSWRIGQRRPVEVKFFAYKDSMQEVCQRLMGRKLLVALAMEGKFASEGFQAIDGDDDMLTAMARELVESTICARRFSPNEKAKITVRITVELHN